MQLATDDYRGTAIRVLISEMPEDFQSSLETLAGFWDRPQEQVVLTLLRRGLRDATQFAVCRDCGCTEYDACGADDESVAACHWASDDLCSACAARAAPG